MRQGGDQAVRTAPRLRKALPPLAATGTKGGLKGACKPPTLEFGTLLSETDLTGPAYIVGAKNFWSSQ